MFTIYILVVETSLKVMWDTVGCALNTEDSVVFFSVGPSFALRGSDLCDV